MFKSTNDYIAGRKNIPTSAGCELVAVRFAQPIVNGDLAANNIDCVGILPAGCVPVSVIIDADKLDSGATPAVAFSLGVSNAAVVNGQHFGTPTDISALAVDGGAVWASLIKTAQLGGQDQFLSKAISRVQPVNYDRYLALKVTTAAAATTAGEVGITLLYRQS